MATYSKPGVYVEETLTPNLPVAPTVTNSVATFIGRADRGPTEVVGGNVVGVPTLVSSWSDFVNNFSFGSSINTFSGAGLGVTTSATSAGYLAGTPNYTITVGSATNLVVGMSVSGTGIDPTSVVTAVSGTTITLSRPITATVSGNVVFTNNALKYAVKSFFDNGGGSAYVLREVNTDAVQASTSFLDGSGTITQAYTWTFDATSQISNKLLRITSATAGQFTGAIVGNSVTFSGITLTNYTFLNSNRWIIAAVDGTGTNLDLVYNGATFASAPQTGTGITITNAVSSSVTTLTVTAKDHGAWGNNVWVGVYPNNNAGYFDLHVYYSTVASSSTALTDSNRVERFVKLSMDSTDPRYVVNNVTSKWITVTDAGSPATSYADLPTFTGTWSTSPTAVNVDSTTGKLNWNASGFVTSAVQAVRLGVNTPGYAISAVAGAAGVNAPTASSVTLPRLDSLTFPLIVNYPAKTDAATINALTAYVATRTDSFAVIDTVNDTVANVLSTISGYNTNQNYGAVYYPNIVIADPASTTGGTKTIPPGGAVAALYSITDTSRGVFKAPAGAQTRISSAVSVYALTSDEFNLVGGSTPNLNVIRFVPGAGICIMGARTLKSNYSDVYVPVRRSLNYLSSNLKNITQFAVFEPNDANLWARVNGVVTGFLDGFWRAGGLAGTTQESAYYVKCDETINTPSAVDAGELRIEVGVALQRPAEFVIIKIGQIDGGATVTTSI